MKLLYLIVALLFCYIKKVRVLINPVRKNNSFGNWY